VVDLFLDDTKLLNYLDLSIDINQYPQLGYS